LHKYIYPFDNAYGRLKGVSSIWIPAVVYPAPRCGAGMTNECFEEVLRSLLFYAFGNMIHKLSKKAKVKNKKRIQETGDRRQSFVSAQDEGDLDIRLSGSGYQRIRLSGPSWFTP